MTTKKIKQKTNSPHLAAAILRSYLRAHWWVYLISTGLICGSNYLRMQVPQIVGRFFDGLQDGLLTAGAPLRYASIICLLSMAHLGSYWLANTLIAQQARKFEHHLRNILFEHWENLSAAYYTHHSVGDLMAHATNDVQGVRQFLSMGIMNSINAFFAIIIAIIMMAQMIDPQLVAVSLIPMPLMVIIVTFLRPRIKKRSRAVQDAFGALAERTQESISGMRVVKAYAQEDYELARFRSVADRIVKRTMEQTLVSALFSPSVQLLSAISIMAALGLGGLRVIQGDLSVGALTAFISYIVLLTNPLQRISMVIDVSQRAGAALSRLSDLLAAEPDVQESASPVAVRKLQGNIVWHELTFTYPDSPEQTLHGLTLDIKAGDTVGILGHTGSGKTTLASLMLRVYNPPRGSIFLDGHDILDLPLRTLRQQIALVPQDVFLFSDSVRANIAFGVEKPDAEQIVTAAKQAQLYQNIMQFPERFETEIGEKGVTLSGGQKQRLALARALIKDSPVLILDDSLSAVDTETEAAILTALRNVRGRQTTILIAHRISTVREADCIIVLDDGRIVQQGTHTQLLAEPGPYQDIYEMQRYGTGESTDAAERRAQNE